MKILRTLTLGAAAVALVACTPAAFDNASLDSPPAVDETTSDAAVDNVDEAPTTTEDAPVTLHRGDFSLKVRKTSEECFGSGVGCLVEFKVVPEYTGEADLDTINADVTYQVSGLEEGPQTNTITFDSGKYDVYETENSGDTTSRGVKLTAKVTRVETY